MVHPELEPIGELIRTTRQQKGLSQRALGDLVGMPQSHISKIESGAVDLQTSSLVQLARALDLELAVVPRTSLPALEALTGARSLAEESPRTADIERKLVALTKQTRALIGRFPRMKALERVSRTLANFRRIQAAIPAGQAWEALQAIETLEDGLSRLWRGPASRAPVVTGLMKDVERGEERLVALRNAIVHGQSTPSIPPVPAYRLDDEPPEEGGADG